MGELIAFLLKFTSTQGDGTECRKKSLPDGRLSVGCPVKVEATSGREFEAGSAAAVDH
jgi:hypothetical protein